jgi:hypothetical protein
MGSARTASVRCYHPLKLATHQKEQVSADAALFVFPVSELKKEDSGVIRNRFEAMFCFVVGV